MDELPENINSLPEALSRINTLTGKKFVIIIDEWDVLIRDAAANIKVQDEYINFCVDYLKVPSRPSISSLRI